MIDVVYTVGVIVLCLLVCVKAWQADQLTKRERRARRRMRRLIRAWTS